MASKAMEREESGVTPRSSKAAAASDVSFPLASLPEYVQEKLAAFDTDGDGIISLAEIMRHGAELEKSKQSVSHYRRLLGVLVVVWAASIAAIFGTVTAGVAVTRQTVVSPGSSVMLTRDGLVVQTGLASQSSDAWSGQTDSFWQELRHFSIATSDNSWLRLAVTGTMRIQGTGALGSVVQVLTASGALTVDNMDVTYSADLAPLLQQLGVPVGPSGRHLLGKPKAGGGCLEAQARHPQNHLGAQRSLARRRRCARRRRSAEARGGGPPRS